MQPAAGAESLFQSVRVTFLLQIISGNESPLLIAGPDCLQHRRCQALKQESRFSTGRVIRKFALSCTSVVNWISSDDRLGVIGLGGRERKKSSKCALTLPTTVELQNLLSQRLRSIQQYLSI